MKLSGAAVLWSVVFILGCVHIQSRSRTVDEKVYQMLRQSQRGKKLSQNERKVRDETGYVTDAEFNEAINLLQSEVTSLTSDVKNVASDVSVVEAKVNTDNCANSACVNQGQCRNRLDGYDCLCKPGFGGANCEKVTGHIVSEKLQVDNGNTEGSWYLWSMCPAGTFARTFRIKLESDQGSKGDDSAMNSLELVCSDVFTLSNVKYMWSGVGVEGTWREWNDCPTGEFIVGFSLKVEPDQGSQDDSAVNGITTTCSGGSTHTGSIGTEGSFGSTEMCPEGHFICGLRTRIEGDQGSGDDSGLNDILMMCCAWW